MPGEARRTLAGVTGVPFETALQRPPRPLTRYHALNPTTRLALCLAAVALAFVVPGPAGPLAVLAVIGPRRCSFASGCTWVAPC